MDNGYIFTNEENIMLAKLNYEYEKIFDEEVVLFDTDGNLGIPKEWSLKNFIDNVKYCIERNLKIDTFPEWQQMKKENEEWCRQNPDAII